VRSEHNADDEDIASSTNYDDAAFSYGGGGGLMIRLYQNEDWGSESEGSAHEVLLDLGVRYISGGEAGYLTSGSIHRQNGTVSYDATHSRTDLITGRIGAVVRF
jgi:hypothetical protein